MNTDTHGCGHHPPIVKQDRNPDEVLWVESNNDYSTGFSRGTYPDTSVFICVHPWLILFELYLALATPSVRHHPGMAALSIR
jgi:hypothetical protein